MVDGWLGSRHGRGTVDGALQGKGVRDRKLEIRPMQEPVRVGGRLAGDAWDLNGNGTMITPCLSMSRDRQPASKRKESVDMAPQPLYEEARRHTDKVAPDCRSDRPAAVARPVTRIGVRQQQRPAASRGCIRRTAAVLADDRFGRGDGPEPARA